MKLEGKLRALIIICVGGMFGLVIGLYSMLPTWIELLLLVIFPSLWVTTLWMWDDAIVEEENHVE